MIVFVLAALVVCATSMLVAASARLSLPGTLLAAYAVASAETVVLAEALTPFHAIGKTGYLAGEALLFAAAVGLWLRLGRPLPPRPRVRARSLLHHPLVLVLLVVVGGALAFEAFLVVHTVPNNWDSMTYHLSRTVAWYQHGSLGYLATHNARQNIFPANAELQILYTFVFLGRDVLAAAPQLLAELALLIEVFGIARRLGFDRPAAAFAALIFATLSEVALEASTAQNDLVVAALVAASVYFVLGRDRRELPLAGLALGLALGTKLTAIFALPIVFLFALSLLPRRRVAELAAAVAIAFATVGGLSYALNIVHSGHPLGNPEATAAFRPDVTAAGTTSTVARTLYRFVDLSGWRADIRLRVTLQNDGIAVFDALHIPAEPLESTQTTFYFLPNVRAHEDVSWFGPLGALLILPLVFGFLAAWCLRRTTRVRGLLAAALPLYAVELAFAYRYNEWLGRFMLVPVVLVAALAARVYVWRVVSTGVAVVGAIFLVLALVHDESKPVGLDGRPAIWNLSRANAEALSQPAMAYTLDFVERVIPRHAAVGSFLGSDDWDYPLYGPRAERHVVPLPARNPLAAAARRGLEWVIVGNRTIRGDATVNAWEGYHLAGSGWWLLVPRGSAAAARLGAAVAEDRSASTGGA